MRTKNILSDQNGECTCKHCQGACTNKPGWFLPGEAEKAAQHLGISLKEFFDQYLLVDFYSDGGHDDTIFLLSPAIVGRDPGEEFPFNPRGTCVFFKDGKCSIHSTKPFECASYIHDDTHEISFKRHKEIAETWNNEESKLQIKELLGRDPVIPERNNFDFFDFLSLLGKK